jgi:hypothetical protein
VQENNTWKILAGHENYLSRKPLWEQEPVDPGPANPELANIRNLAILNDTLLRKHGGDFDKAAKTSAFVIPEVYAEQSPKGMGLLYRRQDLLARRDPEKFAPARGIWAKRLAELRVNLKPAWIGEQLLIGQQELWNDYWSLIDLKGDAEGRSEREERRATLKSKCEDIRETALVLGFRGIVSNSSELLAWALMGEQDEPSVEHVKRIVDAEPYFQEVLDIESSVGWCVSAPTIYRKRFQELSRLNKPSVVDDTVALYTAMKKAGFPAEELRDFLIEACTLVTNNASTADHRRAQAQLHEEEAAMIQLTPENKSGWIQKTLQGQVIHSLSFAVEGWIAAGELTEAERVLMQAEQVLRDAEDALGKDHDDIREARVTYRTEQARLAEEQGDRDKFCRLVIECWEEMHPSDVDAAYIFRVLISIEKNAGTLLGLGTVRTFSEDSLNPFFAPTSDVVAKHTEPLTRFHWRFLQFLSHASSLRNRNTPSFFDTVFTLAEIALNSCLDDNCNKTLLEMLAQAEDYFRSDQASNEKEKSAIRLRGALDPAPAADLQQRLREIEEEDRLLGLREQELRSAIAHHNWIEEFPGIDLKVGSAIPTRAEYQYVAESRTCIQKAKFLILLDRTAEAVDLLAGRAAAIKEDHVYAVDLVLYNQWINAMPAEDRELMILRRNTLIERFVIQHFGVGRSDLIEILRQRFEEY